MLSTKSISACLVTFFLSIYSLPVMADSLSKWRNSATIIINKNIKQCDDNQGKAKRSASIMEKKINRSNKLYASTGKKVFSKAVKYYSNAQNKFQESANYFQDCKYASQAAIKKTQYVLPKSNFSTKIEKIKELMKEASNYNSYGTTAYQAASELSMKAIVKINKGIATYNQSIKNNLPKAGINPDKQ